MQPKGNSRQKQVSYVHIWPQIRRHMSNSFQKLFLLPCSNIPRRHESLQSQQQSWIWMIISYYHFRSTTCNIFGVHLLTFSSGDGGHQFSSSLVGKRRASYRGHCTPSKVKDTSLWAKALETLSPFFLLDYSCSY